MTTTDTRLTSSELLTADDLMRLCGDGLRGELVRGVLHETMPTGHRHGKIATKLAAALLDFVELRGLGTVVSSDAGFWLERAPDTVRAPDVAFTSAQKIPMAAEIEGYAEVVPDLVVEIVSPSQSRRWAHDRARMWLSHGARLVWVVHPDTRTVDVHRPGEVATTRHGSDSLSGRDVLPGFACTGSAVFGP